MADQGVVPIGNIQGAVTSNLDIARSEIRVRRHNDRFDLGRRDIRAVVVDLELQDTEKSNGVADEEIAFLFGREVAAIEDADGWNRPAPFLLPLFVPNTLSDVDV